MCSNSQKHRYISLGEKKSENQTYLARYFRCMIHKRLAKCYFLTISKINLLNYMQIYIYMHNYCCYIILKTIYGLPFITLSYNVIEYIPHPSAKGRRVFSRGIKHLHVKPPGKNYCDLKLCLVGWLIFFSSPWKREYDTCGK